MKQQELTVVFHTPDGLQKYKRIYYLEQLLEECAESFDLQYGTGQWCVVEQGLCPDDLSCYRIADGKLTLIEE